MPERYSPHSFERVERHNRAQYQEARELNADARRKLYQYEYREGEEESEPYDIWDDIASRLDFDVESTLDLGTNDGYFIELLLNRGYAGHIIGMDTEADHFSELNNRLRQEYPGSNVSLLRGDAQKLELLDNAVDQTAALFLLYHVPRYRLAISEISRVTKPGGKVAFSGRGVKNQEKLWKSISLAAAQFNYQKPYSFYAHLPLEGMIQHIQHHQNFRMIGEPVIQKGSLRIPGTEAGWQHYRNALSSLIPTLEKQGTKAAPTDEEELEIKAWIESNIRNLFFASAEVNGGFYEDSVHQGFIICQNIK